MLSNSKLKGEPLTSRIATNPRFWSIARDARTISRDASIRVVPDRMFERTNLHTCVQILSRRTYRHLQDSSIDVLFHKERSVHRENFISHNASRCTALSRGRSTNAFCIQLNRLHRTSSYGNIKRLTRCLRVSPRAKKIRASFNNVGNPRRGAGHGEFIVETCRYSHGEPVTIARGHGMENKAGGRRLRARRRCRAGT